MWPFKWISFCAALVWGCAWLHRPAFRDAEHTYQESETSPIVAPVEKLKVVPLVHEKKPGENSPPRAGSEPISKARLTPLLQEPARPTGTPPLSETTNILLLGIDTKPGEKWLGRPDTLVIAAFSEKTNQLGLVSVPRDLFVDIPGHGPDRINAAFSVALRQKKSPTEVTRRVLEDTLKLTISHTISLDLGAFENLVDAVGGVTVHVPCPLYDNFVDERTATGRRILDVDAGLVKMDGVTAGLYARSRHGRSDFNRARRQQAILMGIKGEFLSMNGFLRLGEFVSVLEKHVRTDMTRAELITLGFKLKGLQSQDIHGLVFGQREAVPTRLEDGKQVLVPDLEAIDQALGNLFQANTPGALPEHATCFAKDAAVKGR